LALFEIMQSIVNTRIRDFIKLISPDEIRKELRLSAKAENNINSRRLQFSNILKGKDDRFVVIAGPCSIHDFKAALEYANKLKRLSEGMEDKLFVMMRVYFEKPRTTVGWKGLINDPYMDETYDMEAGLRLARKLLIEINEIELPAASELLDPIISAYIGELVSWAAIGARTTESQTHRQMASGLSAPVGFKNNSDGNLDVAINAMESAKNPHSFLGVDDFGRSCILKTEGNEDVHIVLRGGKGKPNYYEDDIKQLEQKLTDKGFMPRIMVDCSHENSGKKHENQINVVQNVIAQKKEGNESIFGVMLESNLFEGTQKVISGEKGLKYGVSITDACISWNETQRIMEDIYLQLKQ
jgi:3-deoxy-7-phosphoheptulonate synthase